MTDEMQPWVRLGELLVAQRVRLGWKRRAAFARDKGMPNDRLLFDLENAKRTNYDAATYAVIEQAYAWPTGTVRQVLAGGSPPDQVPVVPEHDDSSFVADSGPDDRPSPGISNKEVVTLIKRQRRELDELLERLGDRPVDGPQ